MYTTVYLIRHSEPFKVHRGRVNTHESILIENEKSPLSINGERLAEKMSLIDEFKSLDIVYSSNYVRAMSTAKYFAFNNNIKVNIDDRFNERIHGIDSWDELPNDFEIKQFNDENYKIGFGESQKEVQNRMFEGLINVIKSNKGKKIAIITHATATTFLLKKWCEVYYGKGFKFNGKEFLDVKFDYCESLKLTFDENNELVDLNNVKV